MIPSDTEHAQAREHLLALTPVCERHESRLTQRGLTPAEIKRALDPLPSISFRQCSAPSVVEAPGSLPIACSAWGDLRSSTIRARCARGAFARSALRTTAKSTDGSPRPRWL